MPEKLQPASTGERFEKLVAIMAALRAPDGCPWDKEQTHASLRQYLLEEAYEVLEVLDSGDNDSLPNELGDLLFQVIFHCQIAQERQAFSIDTVLDAITTKMIERHPHVFGDKQIDSAAEQSRHWESLKRKEGKKSALDGVPVALPGLARAARLQQKAAATGFDFENLAGAWHKFREEVDELNEAIQDGDQAQMHAEFGDAIFALVNVGRFVNSNPEDALRGCINKFEHRFRAIEAHFAAKGRTLDQVSLEEMDAVWDAVKAKERRRA